MKSAGTRILGLGHAVPERRVLNAEIEERLGLEAGWIERRPLAPEVLFHPGIVVLDHLGHRADRQNLSALER
ncbi:hypothetical protein ACIKT0_17320, partial [Hansschlegelia beijingensis]